METWQREMIDLLEQERQQRCLNSIAMDHFLVHFAEVAPRPVFDALKTYPSLAFTGRQQALGYAIEYLQGGQLATANPPPPTGHFDVFPPQAVPAAAVSGCNPPPAPAARKRITSSIGLASFVCGIMSLVSWYKNLGGTIAFSFYFSVGFALVAILTGHIARRMIKRAGTHRAGGGWALTGLIIAYVALGSVFLFFLIFYVLTLVLTNATRKT